MDLSRFTGLATHLSCLSFEGNRGHSAQGGMSSFRNIEPVDIFEQGYTCLFSGVPDVPPDHLGFDGFKECFYNSIVTRYLNLWQLAYASAKPTLAV